MTRGSIGTPSTSRKCGETVCRSGSRAGSLLIQINVRLTERDDKAIVKRYATTSLQGDSR